MSLVEQSSASLISGPTAISALVFLIVFASAFLIGRRLLFPSDSGSSQGRRSDDLIRPPRSEQAKSDQSVEFSTRRFSVTDARQVMATLFRVLAMVVVAALLFLTIASYFHSTPGTGDILLTIVLAAVTLMAAMHFLKLDRRYNRPPSTRQVADLRQSVQSDLSRMLGEALAGKLNFNVQVGDPIVNKIDLDELARARAMQSQGASIEEICLTIEPDYANWPASHQRAFQIVIEAALRDG